MPVLHRIDPDTNILVVERVGRVTPEEEIESVKARTADPAVVPGLPVLIDCRGLEGADRPEVIRRAAERAAANAQRFRSGPVAIVVATEASYGMARMYQALTEDTHPDTRVFRSFEDALDWLCD